MKGGTYTKTLAMIQVRGIFRIRDIRRNVSNQGKYTATIVKEQENEKKRKYNQRVIDVEMGTFTPLVFGTNGDGTRLSEFFKNSRK